MAFRAGTGGLCEFTRMSFGLCNAPATFQRLMTTVLGDENYSSLLIYLDDILVFSQTYEEMLQRLDMVFTRLREHGLGVNPSKCQFFRKEVKFLGHVVSAEGIATDPDKISAIVNRDTPTTVKELQSFIGLAGYYCRFCQRSPRSLRHCIDSLPRRLLSERRSAKQRNQQTVELSRRNGTKKQNAPFKSWKIASRPVLYLATQISHPLLSTTQFRWEPQSWRRGIILGDIKPKMTGMLLHIL